MQTTLVLQTRKLSGEPAGLNNAPDRARRMKMLLQRMFPADQGHGVPFQEGQGKANPHPLHTSTDTQCQGRSLSRPGETKGSV